MLTERTAIIENFFKLRNWEELREFKLRLRSSDSFERALDHYISSWKGETDLKQAFFPQHYLASDLSAVIYGDSPVIFFGTNEWATRRYAHIDDLKAKADMLSGLVSRYVSNYAGKLALIIVPEKDFVIDRLFFNSERCAEIDEAIQDIAKYADSIGAAFSYDKCINNVVGTATITDYAYGDSHLLPRDYLNIFSDILDQWGLDLSQITGETQMVPRPFFGDLNAKFSDRGLAVNDLAMYSCQFERNSSIVSDGSSQLGSPLGDTWQQLTNISARIPGKLRIFGDSHSSILSAGNLTYMFSTPFERSEFSWNPWGVRQAPELTEADYVVMEISQRFVV